VKVKWEWSYSRDWRHIRFFRNNIYVTYRPVTEYTPAAAQTLCDYLTEMKR